MATNKAEQIKEIVKASIWATPSVADQPSVRLVRWSVMQTTEGHQHFVGYNVDGREGRVSTEIQCFNPKTAQGLTRSGRIYQLVGPAGHDSDGLWVWNNLANARKLQWWDVTEEFQRLLRDEAE
ncbi:hypothetical protein E4633_20215 [Geomonas terrae]|uniref:Uncharacterized protein n=1 Tax=Geomonas terrae TaxID=2562681 RepID=A0A4S1C9J1_9BACT|nr:hypothetical protein [Geomonas terrae]TGU69919.1 hypothetical protein E4633_20215 [Geomonas terrae]